MQSHILRRHNLTLRQQAEELGQDAVEGSRMLPVGPMSGSGQDVHAILPQRAVTQRTQILQADERLAFAMHHAQRLGRALDKGALDLPATDTDV